MEHRTLHGVEHHDIHFPVMSFTDHTRDDKHHVIHYDPHHADYHHHDADHTEGEKQKPHHSDIHDHHTIEGLRAGVHGEWITDHDWSHYPHAVHDPHPKSDDKKKDKSEQKKPAHVSPVYRKPKLSQQKTQKQQK